MIFCMPIKAVDFGVGAGEGLAAVRGHQSGDKGMRVVKPVSSMGDRNGVRRNVPLPGTNSVLFLVATSVAARIGCVGLPNWGSRLLGGGFNGQDSRSPSVWREWRAGEAARVPLPRFAAKMAALHAAVATERDPPGGWEGVRKHGGERYFTCKIF